MPYDPINQVKSHSIIVEDARLDEKAFYKGELADELALERDAQQARGDRSIVARIRRWWSPSKVDPNKPHAFVSLDAMTATGRGYATAGRREGAQAAAVLFAESDQASGRCHLPGCGRLVDDPIHQ